MLVMTAIETLFDYVGDDCYGNSADYVCNDYYVGVIVILFIMSCTPIDVNLWVH